MTCGIYKLYFEGTYKVYIGQSEHIEYRYTNHIKTLKQGKAPKKLQEAYNYYGLPQLEILVEADKSELNDLENNAIQIYDSFRNGFNTQEFAEDVPILVGQEHPGSKYTDDQVEAAFKLLLEGALTHKQIAETVLISKNMVNHIAIGTCHRWLSVKYPEEYAKMLSNKGKHGNSLQRGNIYPNIVDPEGNSYTLENLRKFSREHDLPYTSLNNLVKGKVKHVRGWVLEGVSV